MSRNDDQRVADILDAANELASIAAVGNDTFASSPLHIRTSERLLKITGATSKAGTSARKANRYAPPDRGGQPEPIEMPVMRG